MLVLSRAADQDIIIAGNIKVKILSIQGGRVRVGIEAPEEISVLRGELVDPQSEGESAS